MHVLKGSLMITPVLAAICQLSGTIEQWSRRYKKSMRLPRFWFLIQDGMFYPASGEVHRKIQPVGHLAGSRS